MSYAATGRWFMVDPAEEALRTGLAERGVDVSVPNVARIYDYLIGGKDNFEADRNAAEELCRLWPHSRDVCLQNRAFLGRVVRSLAQGDRLAGGRGIRQFLDIGSGLPTADNVHQIAKRAFPGARVVYADYDPVVVLHSKVLLEEDSQDVLAVQADLRDPESLMQDERVRGLIDFREPVAVLMFAILHFLPDSGRPYEIVRRFTDALPRGSVLALSHITGEEVDPDTQDAAIRVYEGASAPACPRSRERIAAFFDGLEMVSPGLVNINLWPEQSSGFAARTPLAMYGGIGVKP